MPPSSSTFAKDTDGFFARHFDRRISGAVSRQLLKTSVTPNQITIAVTLLGVLSGFCLAQPGYAPKVLGAFLFLVTSILDGCDGEVARAKKLTSKLGGWLDLWGDNIVHIAVFYGVGVGLARDTGRNVYVQLGLAASAGTLVAAALASVQTYRKTQRRGLKPGESLFTSVMGDEQNLRSPWERRLTRLSDALARRDFIYAVLALALVGRLDWFLWPCAFGANLYALVLVVLFFSTSRSA